MSEGLQNLLYDFGEALSMKEKLAAWMIANSFATGHGDTFEDLLAELEWQVKELKQRALSGKGER